VEHVKRIALSFLTLAVLAFAGDNLINSAHASASADALDHPPNILFIVMDDVGIDQMKIFGYGGRKIPPINPPRTPNIDAIARAGVRFRNAWSMPECSPSRAIFFEGRFPFRTNVFSAIVSDDLANSQVSPFEMTTPKVLRTRNYESGLFGKFHLSVPTYNPFGNGAPHALGWNFFDGIIEGAPHPIDTTAGGVGDIDQNTGFGPYTCGFVPEEPFPLPNGTKGANTGACYQSDNSCTVISKDAQHPTPGRSCLESGGILVPNEACQSTLPSNLNFGVDNGYYVWERVINHPDGTIEVLSQSDPRARGYISIATTDSAVQWINSRSGRWMATVAYPNAHTPYQQPPTSLLPALSVPASRFDCTGNNPLGVPEMRILSNQMVEAMDKEIGRVLVNTGLATRHPDGSLNYHPETTNTMVIIIGDNGTFAPGVKEPFDSTRAKGTVFQTGVWVPLIVSGPLVEAPGREVQAMVNIADLFELFGEIAGVDVHNIVPRSHMLDSMPMLAYLTNPNQASIRHINFTQTASNIHFEDKVPPPCVITVGPNGPPTCAQLFPDATVCTLEGGVWWGPGAKPPQQSLSSCCAVQNTGFYKNLNILDDAETSTRNDRFKLVERLVPDCTAPQPKPPQKVTEFYEINEAAPTPQIDKDGDSLCSSAEECPNAEQKQNFVTLSQALTAIVGSEIPCVGDGNEDKKVNTKDIRDWEFFSRQIIPLPSPNSSSWYDFNHNGKTDRSDLQTILQHLGTVCTH